MSNPIDLSGQKFGMLRVLSRDGYREKQHATYWNCRCDCGIEKAISGGSLRDGQQSCGCLIASVQASLHRTHGGSGTNTFKIWSSMRARCENKNSQAYPWYGGRGIKVCERWQSFENFLADMGERPKGLSIERKNNNIGYSPDNCVWASRHQQTRNKRNNILVCWDDHVMILKDAAQHFGVDYKLAHCRIKRGWSVADALGKVA